MESGTLHFPIAHPQTHKYRTSALPANFQGVSCELEELTLQLSVL